MLKLCCVCVCDRERMRILMNLFSKTLLVSKIWMWQTTYALTYQECVYSWHNILGMMSEEQIQLTWSGMWFIIFCRHCFLMHLEEKTHLIMIRICIFFPSLNIVFFSECVSHIYVWIFLWKIYSLFLFNLWHYSEFFGLYRHPPSSR